MALKVLCLIDSLTKGGGAERLVACLAPLLKQMGVDIEVAPLRNDPSSYAAEIEASGVPLTQLNGTFGHLELTSLPKVARMAREGKYDIYWGHLLTGNTHAVAAAMLGGKAIITMHSDGATIDPPVRLRDRLEVKWGSFIQGQAAARIAVSNKVARDCERFHGWNDVEVAYNGVDTAALHALADAQPAAATRARWGIADGEFLLVNAARYVPKKGQIHLLRAMALLREKDSAPYRLVICGGGESGEFEREVRNLGLEDCVTLSGVIDQDQLMPLIKAADAFVMPSLREPFGIAAAEALVLGRPTILTTVDGFVEIVGDENVAWMVPPADPEALADAALRIRYNPGVATAMANRAVGRVADHFSLEACARRWIEIFEAVHDGRPIPPCAA